MENSKTKLLKQRVRNNMKKKKITEKELLKYLLDHNIVYTEGDEVYILDLDKCYRTFCIDYN